MNMALKKQFAQQYASNFVETSASEASPHKLIEMLYEGALKNLNLGKLFIDQKNYEKKSEHLNKALSIIAALKDGLDMSRGEVSDNLYSLYDYCYRKTFESSSKNDAKLIEEVIDLLKEVSEAWKSMPENMKRVSREQIEKMSA